MSKRCRIGVVAPASRMSPEVAEKVPALAARRYPDRTPDIVFHPQCLASHGHFAGDDDTRARAFLDVANDASFDAVWFARGGYGSCRVAEAIMGALTDSSRRKAYVGYSDAGMLLAALYRGGFEAVAHGPEALDWIVDRAPAALEPTVGHGRKTAAFNMTVLSQLLGTPLQPDLAGHVLMLEEVEEAMYRIDRSLFHITSNTEIRRVSGLMLGRCSAITPNDPEFGMNEEEIARYWCQRSGIPWLGRADIGHDANNKIVPFGSFGMTEPRE
jgi:muramoyltetrapeptide carboxypeptidase